MAPAVNSYQTNFSTSHPLVLIICQYQPKFCISELYECVQTKCGVQTRSQRTQIMLAQEEAVTKFPTIHYLPLYASKGSRIAIMQSQIDSRYLGEESEPDVLDTLDIDKVSRIPSFPSSTSSISNSLLGVQVRYSLATERRNHPILRRLPSKL